MVHMYIFLISILLMKPISHSDTILVDPVELPAIRVEHSDQLAGREPKGRLLSVDYRVTGMMADPIEEYNVRPEDGEVLQQLDSVIRESRIWEEYASQYMTGVCDGCQYSFVALYEDPDSLTGKNEIALYTSNVMPDALELVRNWLRSTFPGPYHLTPERKAQYNFFVE